ncbi:unnamed protein product [Lathyrus oleraceus]
MRKPRVKQTKKEPKTHLLHLLHERPREDGIGHGDDQVAPAPPSTTKISKDFILVAMHCNKVARVFENFREESERMNG